MAINIKELNQVLNATPAAQNLMLVGKHGIGKSEILTRYFSRRGIPVVTLFLGQMSDPGDLIGLPRINENTGKTIFAPPYWFPVDGKPIVLFLDELNRARPEVLQTVMDLVLNRKLAGRPLPDGCRIISAVNDGDEYQLTDLDPALVSRFNIYNFRPSVSEWLLWAAENKIDERVIDFIRENPKMLDDDGTKDADRGLSKSPDRRAWKKLSDLLLPINDISETHKKMMSGIVGPIATQAFSAFLSNVRTLSGKDILLDYEKAKLKLKKYKLHEMASVNESIFHFLEVGECTEEQKSVVANNLLIYVKDLQKAEQNEEMAHFVSLFEKGSYPRAMSFILSQVSELYNIIVDFIKNL